MPLNHPQTLAEEPNPIAFLLVDRKGRVIFVKEAAAELTCRDAEGTSPADSFGTSWRGDLFNSSGSGNHVESRIAKEKRSQ